MPVPPKPIAPEVIAEGRRLYEHTRVAVDDIAALMGISTRTLYTRIRKWKWRRRATRVPQDEPDESLAAATADAAPVKRDGGDASAGPPDTSAAPVQTAAPVHQTAAHLPTPALDLEGSVAVRVIRAVERQLNAVEKIAAKLNATPEHAEEAERAARALASLSRTLAELKTLRAASTVASKEDNDAMPRNLDDLRRELSARLARLVAGAEGEVSLGAEDGSGD